MGRMVLKGCPKGYLIMLLRVLFLQAPRGECGRGDRSIDILAFPWLLLDTETGLVFLHSHPGGRPLGSGQQKSKSKEQRTKNKRKQIVDMFHFILCKVFAFRCGCGEPKAASLHHEASICQDATPHRRDRSGFVGLRF